MTVSPGVRRPVRAVLALLAAGSLLGAGCSSSDGSASQGSVSQGSASQGSASRGSASQGSVSSVQVSPASPSSTPVRQSGERTSTPAAGFLAADAVHEVELRFDEDDYADMVATYAASEKKEWIEATVVIDGATYRQAGIRLKGNSSLRGVGRSGGNASSTPESLPWLVRLDKYVDGQNHRGVADLVVRGNSSQTSLNEAVALDLLREAGLASQQAALARLRVNGSDARLRLVIESPEDDWADANLGEGILYKAESSGDYSYRGNDPDAYDEVFEQESGDVDDLGPLIAFLDFVNNADDTTFVTELPERLDVAAFARYLAFEELIDNFDDIDGPGNNSYLWWDEGDNAFTVVAWDHNLAFGLRPGGPGGPGGFRGRGNGDGDWSPPGGAFEQPPGWAGARGGPGRGPWARSNVLVTRFLADATFSAMVDEAKVALRESLYAGGAATRSLTRWVELIGAEASDLIDAGTLEREAAAIRAYATP